MDEIIFFSHKKNRQKTLILMSKNIEFKIVQQSNTNDHNTD